MVGRGVEEIASDYPLSSPNRKGWKIHNAAKGHEVNRLDMEEDVVG